MTGTLRLFIGPMFAGKTHALIEAAMAAAGGDISKIVALRPEKDTRDPLGMLASRTGLSIPARHIRRVPQKVTRPVVALDELQFLGLEAPNRLIELKKRGVRVFAAGLNYDASGNEWPSVATLRRSPECEVVELRGQCAQCGAPSVYTYRKSGRTRALVEIGDADKYEPLCPQCWKDRIAVKTFRKPYQITEGGIHRKCLRCKAPFVAPTRFIRLCPSCHNHINRLNY